MPEPLRSYKMRRSRIGATRRAALDTLLTRFTVPEGDGRLDLPALFGGDVPVVVEIGFGTGASTLEMAGADPRTGVLAADVHTPGVATLLLGLEQRGLHNVRVLVGDGRQLLQRRIAPASLTGVRVYFPDPWPKGRHHKRRLVDAGFVALVADRLVPRSWLADMRSSVRRTQAAVRCALRRVAALAPDGGGRPRAPSERASRTANREPEGDTAEHPEIGGC